MLSALVPLSLAALFLLREFRSEMRSTQQRNLDGLVRSFGTTLLGRLNSADDTLRVIVRQDGATEVQLQDNVARLAWVRSVQRVWPDHIQREEEHPLPLPDARQIRALAAGLPVLLWSEDAVSRARVYLVRTTPAKAWLYAEVSGSWLWADAGDFATTAGLLVLDHTGRELSSAGEIPAAVRQADLKWLTGPNHPYQDAPSDNPLQAQWQIRSWEIFLASRYASPSWHLVAVEELPALLGTNTQAGPALYALTLLTLLVVTSLAVSTIRRQLRPLELLKSATRRVSQRDFEAFGAMHWDDEFGDLARAFHLMSGNLKSQFSALETLSEVDRILLRSPDIELVLDTLLPRMGSVLHSASVSVLLMDPDTEDHARAYDCYTHAPETLPVRRVAINLDRLRTLLNQSPAPAIDLTVAGELGYLAPIAAKGITTVRLYPLKFGEQCAGLLCVGYDTQQVQSAEAGVGAEDFADRLSLILANLQQSAKLHRQANFDALTGLLNRQLFSERVASAVESAQAQGCLGSLLYIDLDHFKRVNDTAGHGAGDALLRTVGERLVESIGEGACVARLGGDEFAALLPSISEPDNARQVAERLIASLAKPIVIDGREHHISASIGITVFPLDGNKLEDLFKSSDIAMYQAKDTGRGRAVFFQAEMQRQLLERLAIESGMHRALLQQDFRLVYQPIVSGATSPTLGVEALVRWPQGDPAASISPMEFIPIAEENGLIVKLGDWILRTACRQFMRWRASGLELSYISVNVSVRQLREAGFLERVAAALADSGLSAGQLQLEMTESVLAHGEELQRTLLSLSSQGIRLALDDFGTGYSSLSYLRAYPIHTVKIDRSFICGIPQDPSACRLAESIIVMCAALGKEVVAEGVETTEQLLFLQRAGCTSLQGYLLGRPMEAEDLPGFARRLRSMAAGEHWLPGLSATSASA